MTGLPGASWTGWAGRHAAWLLGASLAAHVLLTALSTPAFTDARVYYEASPGVLSGQLYEIRSGPHSLVFTYPPFAALVLLPLSWLPWPVAVVVVQAVSVIALVVIVDRSAVLLDGVRMERCRLMLWVAVVLWCEPVHHTLNLGQVNLVLAAVVLSAAALPPGRAVLAGGGVGIAAGMKLTPAVTGAYLLLVGRRKAAFWSLAAFGVTLAIGWLVAPRESVRFWLGLLWDTSRVGWVMSVRNQSLLGVLARLTGQDTGLGLLWCACAMLVLGAAVVAGYRATRYSDRLGLLLVVQLTGLMLLPISWSHHWVWCVPALMWLAAPHNRTHLAARLALAAWALAAGTDLVPHLATVQDALTPAHNYPRALAWLGSTYCLCGAATLLAVAHRKERSTGPVPVAGPRQSSYRGT
ncbi:glycosyltransferase 87 family protein [Streptomyces sp. NPDC102270]|uniref:glycosyltransferase 87 family protein n=1 Tax=Streptomyces sp. NPDC102270 TaxID=3366150 RepID=UPI0038042B9A